MAVLAPHAVAHATPTTTTPLPSSVSAPERTVVNRTETSTSYRLADGRFVTELHSGPVRAKQQDGSWADIDTDLVRDGSGFRPRAAVGDVRFSGGGKGPFAELRRKAGDSIRLNWDGDLPKPLVQGNKATYQGVVADGAGDLSATALPSGLRFDVVLNRRPSGPVEVRVPLTAEGMTVGEAAGDRLTIEDGDTVIAASSTPVLYDSAAPQAYRPGKGSQKRGTTHHGSTGDIAASVKDSSGGKTLVLKPSHAYLADPDTAYPVTIDPSVVLPLSDDTDVNSVFDGNNVSGGYLKVGTETDGEKGRAYLRFNTQGLKTPTKAVLKLTNLDAPSCGAVVGEGVQVRRVTDFWEATEQTWTPQPSNTTEDAVVSTEGSQLGSCGSGTMAWDVTPMVAKWAGGTPNHGLVLQSPSESATRNYRVFAAAENPDGLEPPVLEVTSDEVITPGEGEDPADPGPAPKDLWPGRADTLTGVWITDGTDLADDGLVTTRSHSAGQRADNVLPNENVLGPNWRFEPLGDMLGDRLKDFSANGYVQVNLASGTASRRFEADPQASGRFVSEDGFVLVKNANGSFTQTAGQADDLTHTWTLIGSEYLITSVKSTDLGTTVISYDGSGRVTRLAVPKTPETDCTVDDVTQCAVATYQYATATTATASAFGDVAGQLKTVTYDATGDTAPVVAAAYAYDTAKRLRTVTDARQIDGDPVVTSSYTYDSSGNITRLSTPERGTWNLTYSTVGKLATATQATAPAGTRALQPQCVYASQYLYGTNGCWVSGGVPMDYGGPLYKQSWKKTPGGKSVVGVTFDHCTFSVDRPNPDIVRGGFDFTKACDMHDYGYGIIYLSKTDRWTKSKKGAVDSIFYTTLRDHTCNAYPTRAYAVDGGARVNPRDICRRKAYMYYLGVKNLGGWGM